LSYFCTAMDFSDLSRLASGHVEARIVQTAVRLGVFDVLQRHSLRAPAVSALLQTDLRATELLLNALTALGLLQNDQGGFSVAPVSEKYLLRDSTHYLGDMILFDASLWPSWERLEEAVRTGKPVRKPDMYQGDDKETRYFIDGMDSLVKARGDAQILAEVLDWTSVETLLDVGSGPGTYPIYLCRRFPQLRATIFDLPATLRLTEGFIRDSGLRGRIQLIAGDYRADTIPGRYQAIFMSNIIHSEDCEENEHLVKKLAAGNLASGGRLIIKDHILDETRAHPPVGAIFSLLMLLTTQGGRCYAFDEVKAWMVNAGLKNIGRVDLPPPLTSSLITGER
jgi:O-methyltransferase domain/Dimerisation domain